METNETRTPWEKIGKPATANGFTHRRVNGVHPHDFFWGRDIEGRYVFRFMGQFPADLADSAPKMSGVKIVGGQEDERSHLSLILDTPDNREIFYYLCLSILHATEKMEDEPDPAIAKIVLIHLARWQKLLKNSSNLLSEARQIGLFGELALLRDLYLPNLGGQITSYDGVSQKRRAIVAVIPSMIQQNSVLTYEPPFPAFIDLNNAFPMHLSKLEVRLLSSFDDSPINLEHPGCSLTFIIDSTNNH